MEVPRGTTHSDHDTHRPVYITPSQLPVCPFFFLNDPPPTKISPLPLHDALPISGSPRRGPRVFSHQATASKTNGRDRPGRLANSTCRRDYLNRRGRRARAARDAPAPRSTGSRSDRKSTRLNSSHSQISYAVFCLK